jgi:malonate-semialdehyde dehydrogenase (acetylating) / methylmalonate-semialdehyde dehydrogenase
VGLISSVEGEGGKILLDGRNMHVPGYPDGNFVGPTILEANTSMKCYQYVCDLFWTFVLIEH